MQALGLLSRVTARDLCTAIAAAWQLTRFWALVRWRPVPAVERALQPPGTPHAVPRMTLPRLSAIVSRVAAMHPLRPKCLERALTISALASRDGRRAHVCIGAARDGRAMRAHAWAVVDDTTIDPLAAHYRQLYVLTAR